jgi:hypothetical protein
MTDKELTPAQEQARQLNERYALLRQAHREQWLQSDAEDWCARKEVRPGTYHPAVRQC